MVKLSLNVVILRDHKAKLIRRAIKSFERAFILEYMAQLIYSSSNPGSVS